MKTYRLKLHLGLCALAITAGACSSASETADTVLADTVLPDTGVDTDTLGGDSDGQAPPDAVATDAADTAGLEDVVPGDDASLGDTAEPDVAPSLDVADITELPPAEAFDALQTAWCAGYAAHFCGALETCGCASAPGYPVGDACETAFVAQCGTLLGQYKDAVLSGQAEVTMDGLTGCLDRIGALAAHCAKLPGDSFFIDCPILAPPGGLPALPGAGQPCAEGGRCALGSRCSSKGVCQVPGQVGAPCEGLTDCDASLRCTAGKCAELDLSNVGAACAPNGDCGELVCAASSHRVCEVKTSGAPCIYDEGCLNSEFCSEGTCTPWPGAGQACANGAGCMFGLGCNEAGTCAALPGDGQSCALGVMGPLLCAPGTTCKDGLCGPIPGKDDPCAQGTPACGPGLGCAFGPDGSVCRTPGPEGTYCENDPTCADGLYCEFTENACRPWVAFGGPCSAGNECGPSGACLPDGTFTFRCAPIPGAGDACFLFDCGEGLACVSPYTEGACVSDFCTALKF